MRCTVSQIYLIKYTFQTGPLSEMCTLSNKFEKLCILLAFIIRMEIKYPFPQFVYMLKATYTVLRHNRRLRNTSEGFVNCLNKPKEETSRQGKQGRELSV